MTQITETVPEETKSDIEIKRCRVAFEDADRLTQLMALLAASKTVKQKKAVMDELNSKFGNRLGWVSVGNNNNIAVAKSGTNLVSTLTERYTNAEDAIIHLLFESVYGKWDDVFNPDTCDNPQPQPFKNPREAADFLLNVDNLPKDMQQFIKTMKRHGAEGFIKLIQYKDAFECRDVGCGMSKEVFKGQFLKYHGEYKASKHHQKGKFSQGSMQSFGYSEEGTVIFSKTPDSEACVITIIEQKKAKDYYHINSYKYLTVDGDIFETPIDIVMHAENDTQPDEVKNTDYMAERFRMTSENFPHGTSVRHLQPKGLEKFSSHMGGVRASLYRAFNYHMPLPSISARIENRTPVDNKGELREKGDISRPINGLISMLNDRNAKEATKHKINEHSSPKLNGRKYSIDIIALNPGVKKDGKIKGDPSDMMIPKNQSCIFTLGGQTHAKFGLGAIKTELNIGLIKYLIVHVNVDGLSLADLQELLGSNREGLREGDQQDAIMDDLKSILKKSDAIKELQRELAEKSRKKSAGSVDANFKSIVAKFINWTKGARIGKGAVVKGDGIGTTGDDVPKAAIKTSDNPTYIKWSSKKDITFYDSKSAHWAKLETDASSKFHNVDEVKKSCIRFSIIDGDDVISLGGTTSLVKGKMSLQLNNITRGDATIKVELFRSEEKNEEDLIDEAVIGVTVTEKTRTRNGKGGKHKNKGKGKGRGKGQGDNFIPEIEPIWVTRMDEEWSQLEDQHNGGGHLPFRAVWTGPKQDSVLVYISEEDPDFRSHYNALPKKWKDTFKTYVGAGTCATGYHQKVQESKLVGQDTSKNESATNEIVFGSILMNSAMHVMNQKKIEKLENKQESEN